MRDVKESSRSFFSKIEIYGVWNFLIKCVEVSISLILTNITLRLKAKGEDSNRDVVFIRKLLLLQRDQFTSKHSGVLLKEYESYLYTIYDKKICFREDGLLSGEMGRLSGILEDDEIGELVCRYGHHNSIGWSRDPLHGFKFERKKVAYNRAEIKIPWELGRFNYYPQLALHHHSAEDVAECFYRDLISFYVSNASTDTIQWSNAMEAGIRIFNVVITYLILKERGVRPPSSVDKLFVYGVSLHRTYILLNNEFSFIQTSNHFACNLLGLAATCMVLQNSWLEGLVKKLFLRELDRNTFHDFLTEGSTAYHRFTAEVYLSIYLLSNSYKSCRNYSIEKKLKEMGQIVSDIENPLGLHTQFGDSDGGFLNWLIIPYSQKLTLYTPYDVKSFEAFLVKMYTLIDIADFHKPEKRRGLHLLAGGSLILYRDSDVYLLVNNIVQVQGVYNKAHYHDDHGYMEFFLHDKAVVVDAGMPCYTLDTKKRFVYQSYLSHFGNSGAEQGRNPFGDFSRKLRTISVNGTDEIVEIEVTDREGGSMFIFRRRLGEKVRYELSFASESKTVLFPNYLSSSIEV
jgi:hypothetical protein